MHPLVGVVTTYHKLLTTKHQVELYACIWHYNEQSEPYKVSWTHKTTQGWENSVRLWPRFLTVDQEGLNCEKLGVIFGPFRDDPTIIVNIAYNADETWYSGSAKLSVANENSTTIASIADYNPGTSICIPKAHCIGTSQIIPPYNPDKPGFEEVYVSVGPSSPSPCTESLARAQ